MNHEQVMRRTCKSDGVAVSPHIVRARRTTREVLAIGLVGGAGCWLLAGTAWGAVGLWSMLATVVLVLTGLGRSVGAGEP